ncbi:MAG TPA: L,D-transpeptidase family protein [Phycisphaerales bacterium]|nr:L,D-transpeptidase family protein [Phycisphaerales bacterium]
MTLSSQMARSDRPAGTWVRSSGRTTRRRPPTRLIALAGAGAVALGLAAWGGTWLIWGGEPGLAVATDLPAPMVGEAGSPAGAPRSGTSERQEPGLVMEMGRGPMSPPDRAPTTHADRASSQPRAESNAAPLPAPAPASVTKLPVGPGGRPPHQPAPSTPAVAPSSGPGPGGTASPSRPATSPAAPAAANPVGAATPGTELARFLGAAEQAQSGGRLVEARTLLNRALLEAATTEQERHGLRTWLAQLNEGLVFSPAITAGDPIAQAYTIERGDSLARVTAKLGLGIDWRAVQRINRITDPGRIQVGQKIKVLRGPFHAVVSKSAFRLDLYAGEPVRPASAAARADGVGPGWVYICSFPVGLGEHNMTPVGTFVVKPKSKLLNPFWTNPRTGERFDASDPNNPIGEHWLGLDGADEQTRVFQGYGLHGTIQPESIGKEMSMGCVRMRADDIARVWELLEEGVSTVRIVP